MPSVGLGAGVAAKRNFMVGSDAKPMERADNQQQLPH
jgi:hypothetical protein